MAKKGNLRNQGSGSSDYGTGGKGHREKPDKGSAKSPKTTSGGRGTKSIKSRDCTRRPHR